ncbi:MAG: hypothetical protein RL637_296 [Pseudomonadota bacterium]
MFSSEDENEDLQPQDVDLPLNLNFNSLITINVHPIVSVITHGALLNVELDNLKFLKIKAISSLKIQGIEGKKIHRFYFETEAADRRLFLQILSNNAYPDQIEEILFCGSLTEPPENQKDIGFFLGENQQGLGERIYHFSRDDLNFFLLTEEVEKRLAPECEQVEYLRINEEIEFMPPFTGIETVIFDSVGSSGQTVKILNLMPHFRSLSEYLSEILLVSFWLVIAEDGHTLPIEEQLPLAEYIFAFQLDQNNITVI